MKKALKIIFAVIVTVCVISAGILGNSHVGELKSGDYEKLSQEVLRLHIRADSNDEYDQQVKLCVRDALLEEFSPEMSRFSSLGEAVRGTKQLLPDIEAFVNQYLAENRLPYSASAEVSVSDFPDRVYDKLLFPAGEYTALKINLGSGEGENWWCVMYPPLCFANVYEDEEISPNDTDADEEIEIRWKIFEWFEELFG